MLQKDILQQNVSGDQLRIYRSCVSLLADPQARDANKADAAKELSSNLEHIIELSPHHPQFFENTINTFIKVLEDTRPQFVSDYPIQVMRKSLLEMIHRLPTNKLIKTSTIIRILKLMFNLFEVENEENVQVILRIIIELHKALHKHRRDIGFMPETQSFLDSVKNLYSDMQQTYDLNKIFEKKKHQEEDLTPAILEQYLANIHTLTIVETEKKQEGKTISYGILPRAKQSLKVLADLPIIVVLLYQIHKTQLQQTASEFIPLIMNTITLRPPDSIRNSEKFDIEIYVEFITAQVKALAFIAFIVRANQEVISNHSNQLVQGMLMLLKDCPHEVASLRKELLATTRHILQTPLRTKFINNITYFLDESVLTGKGWTARESLRPIAYNTLADLVHNVRQELTLNDLAAAVNTFSKNVHDDTIPPYIQSMSCKLLLTLAESASKKLTEKDALYIRELLMRLIEVYVLKFKVLATLHLPILFQRIKAQQAQASNDSASVSQAIVSSNNSGFIPQRDASFTIGVGETPLNREEKPKFEFPSAHSQNYSMADCKSMVKTLVIGVKTVTNTIPSYKFPNINDQILVPPSAKVFQPKDTIVFVRLVKYALKALDIYMISPPGPTIPPMMNQMNRQQFIAQQNVRPKEEKEILEHFAGIFTALHPLTFHEIFSKLIDFLVERMHQNFALQVIVNSFLATSPTSPIFATILLEYLLVRMEEIGSNVEKSNLYLRLFKMVFGSVSLYAVENEQMLKPHLHNIVNKSMELALGAKDPYNYFLLLRALFRSIGGGSHDLLYQEFLPLLPNLLQGLNSLQSGLHKQHIKDLFVELCLTVPVRLSSLLPYLPMLMDPLVSALNGSQTLISQGLRTLELCVDNLQPDFLYEHIQPVKAELMQALWRTLRHPSANIASTSFRVLGKFGGGNRKMMIEPQRLKYVENKEGLRTQGSTIEISFPDQRASINLPIDRVVYTAYDNLKQINIDRYLRHESWKSLKAIVAANCGIVDDSELKIKIKKIFADQSFATEATTPSKKDYLYKCQDVELRKVHQTALSGMFMAAAVRECEDSFLEGVVRHYVMVAIYQHMSTQSEPSQGMDPYVLIDALATIFGYEEKELCKPAHDALALITDTTALLLKDPSKERAYELPYISYLVKSMYKLCYERAWYAKMGGCVAIKFFFEDMPLGWLLKYQKKFVKALLYVMRDLTGEVSSGAVDMAQANLETMLNICARQIESTGGDPAEGKALIDFQTRSLNDVTELLVREVTSPNLCVRTQAMRSLETLAKLSNKSVTQVMEPHRKILENMIPLFASLTDHCLLEKQPVRTQIGLMHGTTFCTNLQTRLFTIDTTIEKHKDYINQLIKICEGDDAALKRLPCYTKVTNLVPVRIAALQALSACHYLKNYEQKIFNLLYKSTESTNLELQEKGYSCMKHFTENVVIDPAFVLNEMKPLLERLQDSSQWDLNSVRRVRYMTQLFPSVFGEEFCRSLTDHLEKLALAAITDLRTGLKMGERVYDRCKVANEKLKVCAGILEIFAQLPTVPPGIPEKIMILVFKTEKDILIEPGSLLREPLKKFLKKYANHAVSTLLLPTNLVIEQIYRFIMFLLKGPGGEPFRMSMRLADNINKLTKYANGPFIDPYRQLVNVTTLPDGSRPQQLQTRPVEYDCRFPAIAIISTLVKYDDSWLMTRPQIVEVLQRLWNSEEFHDRHGKIEHVDYVRWKEPKLVVKCLLNYFKHNNNAIELLFQLLRAFLGRYLCEFEFLRHFLEKTVIDTYSIEWKREAFFKFVTVFRDPSYSQDLKAKILQLIIIPTFSHSFEKGLGDALIGGSPQPDNDNNKNNLINVFIEIVDDKNKCIYVSDSVRIILLQFSCLLVEQASAHIHDVANKRQGKKLRFLMTFAWPCLLSRNCVDPATKYHGHLLLANIISKFAVHSRIVLQVFHSLLKAHAPEARAVVRQALDVLTPAMPHRIENGDNMNMLTLWTKKIITEEGHMLPQLVHMLQLLVRHYRVYYPVRNHLIQHMVSSIQRLGFAGNTSIEHKKIAVDLCEVIIRWEMQRIREERERQAQGIGPRAPSTPTMLSKVQPSTPGAVSQTINDLVESSPATPQQQLVLMNDSSSQPTTSTPMSVPRDAVLTILKAETPDTNLSQRMQTQPQTFSQKLSQPPKNQSQPQTPQQQAPQQPLRQSPQATSSSQMSQSSMSMPMMSLTESNIEINRMNLQEDCYKPLDPHYANEIINKLLQMACQVNEPSAAAQGFSSSPGENLSKRCVMLLKSALKPDVWSNPELSEDLLKWFAELLRSLEPRQQPGIPQNIGNICTALELLSFLSNTLPKETLLNIFSSEDLQRGIIACINSCSTSKVIRSGSSLLQRLMSVFPPQSSTSSNPSQHERIENLYTSVHSIILQGLNNYETAQQAPPSILFSTLMILKAACTNNPCYIDRLMPTFIRVLQRMTKEHLAPAGEVSAMGSELLILSLDLVKNRISSMNQEMRKVFIQHILANLIERSTDVKVSKAITKIVEDWVKHKQSTTPSNIQGPNLREKTLLLIKLMYNIEKRDTHDLDLIAQFLELINYVYRDDELKATDLTTKLETAFMLGLRFVQPTIRAKFFQVFNQSVKPKLYERLMYIVCAQNWETIGHHYWIQQCIEFILVIASDDTPIKYGSQNACLPPVPKPTIQPQTGLGQYNLSEVGGSPHIINMLTNDTAALPTTINSSMQEGEEDDPMFPFGGVDDAGLPTKELELRKRLLGVLNTQANFYDEVRKIKTGNLLQSISQICHSDTHLAHDIWIKMFPRIWSVLNDSQMTLLGREIVPFLCSGSHVKQIECHPSAIGTFMEAVSLCRPTIQIRPVLLRYLGKNHNLWQRAALMLEDMYKDKGLEVIYPVSARINRSTNQQNTKDFDIITLHPQSTLAEEAMDSLADLLELLHEEDLWCGLWQKRAQYPETLQAISYEQQGLFQQAQECYEAAMNRQKIEFDNTYVLKPGMKSENKLWERHWIRCSKELNQWDSLLEYGNSQHAANPILVMESSWRVPNWQLMRKALNLVEANCPVSMAWLVALYKGYNFICNRDEYDLNAVDSMINCASDHCIKEWRKLPHIVSHAHIRLLHGAQRIMELYEALQLHTSFLPQPLGRPNNVSHDMKAVVKTWRNRQPILSDDLSHWSDIFTWRQHHYQAIVAHYDAQSAQMVQTGQYASPDPNASNAMLGVHASAQAIIQFGEIARRQGLINVCLDSINRIHTIPSVPIVDCFQKIRQQVKCYLQMPVSPDKAELLDGLEIIESTNLKYFAKDMIAEFYALKGMFLSQLERHEEANKAYSAAAQLHDMLPRAWAAWGEHMEGRFTQETCLDSNNPNISNGRQMDLGISAITCYLQACRHQTEPKSRKFLAKVLWLLSFDDERSQLAKIIEEYHGFVPPNNWLAWIPQLLQCMLRNEGEHLRKLLIFVGRSYPQAVYFPTMTLFRTLKMYIHAFKLRNNSINSAMMQQQQQQQQSAQVNLMTTACQQQAGQPNLMTYACQQPTQMQQQPTQANMMPQVCQSGRSNIIIATTCTQQTQLQQTNIMSPVCQQQPVQSNPITTNACPQQPGHPNLLATNQQPPQPIPSTSQQQQSMQPQLTPRQQPMAPASLWRCSEIMKTQRDVHPTTLSSLEGIAEQMVWFRVYWYEEVQKQVQQALFKCYVLAFENRHQVANATINQPILNYVRKLVSTFGVGITGNITSVQSTGSSSAASELLAERVHATSHDPEYQHTKEKFAADFEEASLPTMTLMTMIDKLQKWIKILEHKTRLMPKTYLIEEKCRFLSNFSQHTADVELPGESLLPKHNHYYVRIARFMPEVEVISKHNTAARRIFIRGHNGKVYPYLVVSDSFSSDARREERVLQLLRLLNLYLGKRKETGRRFLNYTVPRVVAISPDMRLVEDNPASLSLMDIFKRRIGHQKNQDSPIMEYYKKLETIQASNMQATQKHLRDILIEIQNKMVSTKLFKEWVSQTYLGAIDHWCFRSQFTLQMSLASFSEYVLHLTRLNPDMMYIHQDSGLINVAYYKFDVDDRSGDILANRAVPFRLTHNISEFMTQNGVVGPFSASMIAVSRCLLSPNFKVDSILKAILRDEMLDWYKISSRSCAIENQMQGELLINMVNKAVRNIIARMHALASMDKPLESQTSCLVDMASSNDQLCQMDPSWHPWL